MLQCNIIVTFSFVNVVFTEFIISENVTFSWRMLHFLFKEIVAKKSHSVFEVVGQRTNNGY